MKINGEIQYVFRRPKLPIICVVGEELVSAESATSFRRALERFELRGDETLDIVDATAEGWAFHVNLRIVSPLTLKRKWTKAAVIRLFNESQNARRTGVVYPESSLSNKTLRRIIAEVTALAARLSPHRPHSHTNTETSKR